MKRSRRDEEENERALNIQTRWRRAKGFKSFSEGHVNQLNETVQMLQRAESSQIACTNMKPVVTN